jgi:hypothetical protein
MYDFNSIKKYENVCYNTHCYAEYILAYTELLSLLKVDSNSEINGLCSVPEQDRFRVIDIVERKQVSIPKGTVLTHMSETEFTELKPSFRSRDGRLYSSNRIYFTTNLDQLEDSFRYYSHKYEYVCDGTESVYLDSEYSGESGFYYIESEKPLAVKKI